MACVCGSSFCAEDCYLVHLCLKSYFLLLNLLLTKKYQYDSVTALVKERMMCSRYPAEKYTTRTAIVSNHLPPPYKARNLLLLELILSKTRINSMKPVCQAYSSNSAVVNITSLFATRLVTNEIVL